MNRTHIKQLLAGAYAAARNFFRSPGFAHAVLAALITLVVGAFFALVYLGPWGNAAVCAFLMYVMRERAQSEIALGSKRIPLWRWLPRAYRDFLWAGNGGGLVALAIEWQFG
jgi:hypothetical protein